MSKLKEANTVDQGKTAWIKKLINENQPSKPFPADPNLTDQELNLLIDTFAYIRSGSLSIHQRQLYAALCELKASR